ncbi:carbohydrate ABC transporter permease [Nakamurella endophytica]|uniref:ABC transporter permease n=1 Tax=Nakamurella endophytica TaxID=1748367 RepID=A0A917SUA8_9ACTN|nr:sugar ABC transporter permease [Nakamurella endophytica]GGL98868.1 ABC transporter permease [Nakamurella endophytica]
MLAPTLVVIGVFVVYPIVGTGYLSLTSWDGFSEIKKWVGLGNYTRLFRDPAFLNSLWVTVLYGAGVCVAGVVSGLGIAVLLNGAFRGRGVYRAVFFLPVVTSSIAAATVWRYVFGDTGVLDAVLRFLHLPAPNWLGDPSLALVSLVLLTAWKSLGLNVVLYLTALQTLPADVYEAAAVDGASRWQQLRRITVPLLAPMTFFVVIEGLITSFQSFDLVYALTGGGPLGGTETLGFLTYREAFRLSHFGYGAAVAYTAFALVLGVTLIQWRLGGRERWSS